MERAGINQVEIFRPIQPRQQVVTFCGLGLLDRGDHLDGLAREADGHYDLYRRLLVNHSLNCARAFGFDFLRLM